MKCAFREGASFSFAVLSKRASSSAVKTSVNSMTKEVEEVIVGLGFVCGIYFVTVRDDFVTNGYARQ